MVEFEPFSPKWRDDPYAKYRELRDRAPVHHSPEANVWCLSRYEDVHEVLKDAETYSSKAMGTLLVNGGNEKRPALSFRLLSFIARMMWKTRMHPAGFVNARNLIAEDGESHLTLRNVVNRGFTPRRIADFEPRVHELARECLSGFRDDKEFDVVRDLAVPLPVTIIAELLGIEPERQADFKRWSDNIIEGVTSQAGREDPLAKTKIDNFIEIVEYLRKIARARRREPAEDLISTIVSRKDGQSGLNDYDVVQFVILLLVAGNETTTNLIGNATNALFDNPEQLEILKADPSKIAAMLEETLRYDPPIQLLFRTTTRDVELHGQTITKGSVVAPIIGSANRDERRFLDPDRFDIDRRSQPHLGFGFGAHFCLGSSLARLEARGAFEALLPEFASARRVEQEREWIDSFIVRGPRSLILNRVN